jgi:hypothetical protein
MGIGQGSGEDRAEEAAKNAISSPLLESSIEGARGVLLSVSGPSDLTLHEVNKAADTITRVAHPDANIIFGAVVDDGLARRCRIIAAGFDKLLRRSHPRPYLAVAQARARDGGPPRPHRRSRRAEETPAGRRRSSSRRRTIFRPAPDAAAFDADEDLDSGLPGIRSPAIGSRGGTAGQATPCSDPVPAPTFPRPRDRCGSIDRDGVRRRDLGGGVAALVVRRSSTTFLAAFLERTGRERGTFRHPDGSFGSAIGIDARELATRGGGVHRALLCAGPRTAEIS